MSIASFGQFSLDGLAAEEHTLLPSFVRREADLIIALPKPDRGEVVNFGELGCTVYWYGIIDSKILHQLLGVLQRLEQDDYAGLNDLGGSFLMIVHWHRRRALMLITDRSATQRTYFAVRDGTCYFFPRLRSFLRMGFRFHLSREHLLQFLTFRCILQGTILENVHEIPPGCCLQLESGVKTHRLVRYWNWNWNTQEDWSVSPEQYQDLIGQLADGCDAVYENLPRHLPIALYLSGGIDSRLALSHLLRHRSPHEILAVTFGCPGTYDYEIARLIADRCGLEHLAIDTSAPVDYARIYREECWESDGMTDLIHALNQSYRIDRLKHRVVVTGYLGDCLAGGAAPRELLKMPSDGPFASESILKLLVTLFSFNLVDEVVQLLGCSREEYWSELLPSLRREQFGYESRTVLSAVSSFSSHLLAPRFNHRCVVKGATEVLYFYPYIDRGLIQFWTNAPPRVRVEQRLLRDLCRRESPELFSLPLSRLRGEALLGGVPSPPLTFIDDPEINVADYQRLLREDFEFVHFIRGLLDSLQDRQLVHPDVVDRFWREHRAQTRKKYFMILRLASLEQVFQCFDNAPAPLSFFELISEEK